MISPHDLSNADLAVWCQEQFLSYGEQHGYRDTSSHYQSCQITLLLNTSVAGYDPIHLDGLLQKAVVLDALGGIKAPSRASPYRIPLPLEVVWRSPDDLPLYHCSSLLPLGDSKKGVLHWTKKNHAFVSRVTTRKKDGTYWQPDDGAGQFKVYNSLVPLTHTHALTGWAVGDSEEILRLLPFLSHTIGKKRAWGQGSLVDISVVPSERPFRFVFVSEDSRLLRPVPQQACTDLGMSLPSGTPIQQIGWTPPYWLPANQSPCYAEQQEVRFTQGAVSPASRVWSVPAFLWQCDKHSFVHAPREECVLKHISAQLTPPGSICALTGLPIIEERAVPVQDGISLTMGNVVDFLKCPSSAWLAESSAVIMSQPKRMHRSLVALMQPDGQDGMLWWPVMGVDPKHPELAAHRPLWREVMIALLARCKGWPCVIICKDEVKSRTWPRARLGVIGERTPILFQESNLGMADIILVDIMVVCEMMLFIESLLDQGYGKQALLHGLVSLSIDTLIRTLDLEKQLVAMRTSAEFPFAWRIARSTAERALRKDVHLV